MRIVSAALCALLVGACGTETKREVGQSDAQLAAQLGKAFTAACPTADPGDEEARDTCADRLAADDLLRGRFANPLLWGAQSAGAGYELARSNTTQFNPLTFLRGYLATFWFPGPYTVEELSDGAVLHLPIGFRSQLDPGAYPYPFWHSAKKWQSYQRARELLLIVRAGQIEGVLRSTDENSSQPLVEHTWDGEWSWQSSRGSEPHTSLYAYLLSDNNPHRAELEESYRAFEAAQRSASCTVCHSPANPSANNPLYMLTYPGQALAARDELVARLERNDMPPASGDAPPGISDEGYRTRLLQLARAFRDAGDRALDFEDSSASALRKGADEARW